MERLFRFGGNPKTLRSLNLCKKKAFQNRSNLNGKINRKEKCHEYKCWGGELRELKPRILVIGVGGAGGNAINAMIEAGMQGVNCC